MEFVNEQDGGLRNPLNYAMSKDFEKLEKYIKDKTDYKTKEKIQANITRYTKDDIELWDWVKIMTINFEGVKEIIDNIIKKKPNIYSRIKDGLILSLSRCYTCNKNKKCCKYNGECGDIDVIHKIINEYELIDKVKEMSIRRKNIDNDIECNKYNEGEEYPYVYFAMPEEYNFFEKYFKGYEYKYGEDEIKKLTNNKKYEPDKWNWELIAETVLIERSFRDFLDHYYNDEQNKNNTRIIINYLIRLFLDNDDLYNKIYNKINKENCEIVYFYNNLISLIYKKINIEKEAGNEEAKNNVINYREKKKESWINEEDVIYKEYVDNDGKRKLSIVVKNSNPDKVECYKNKYLKYKNKYLNLKKQLNL